MQSLSWRTQNTESSSCNQAISNQVWFLFLNDATELCQHVLCKIKDARQPLVLTCTCTVCSCSFRQLSHWAILATLVPVRWQAGKPDSRRWLLQALNLGKPVVAAVGNLQLPNPCQSHQSQRLASLTPSWWKTLVQWFCEVKKHVYCAI